MEWSERRKETGGKEDEEDEDPLDAFMAGLEQESKKGSKRPEEGVMPMSSKKAVKESKGVRGDIDEEDVEESYYKFMADNPNAGVGVLASGSGDESEETEALEYDRDGNPVASKKAGGTIDPLPPIDHSTIEYESFNRNFYEEHEEIKSLNWDQVNQLRKTLGIRVFGSGQPKPVCSFAHFSSSTVPWVEAWQMCTRLP